MEETKGEQAWTFFAILFACAVAAVLHYAEQGTDNLLHQPAKSVTRERIAPVFNDEMERRVIKAEMLRPTGTEVVFQPAAPEPSKCPSADLTDTDRSGLASIIIKEVLQ